MTLQPFIVAVCLVFQVMATDSPKGGKRNEMNHTNVGYYKTDILSLLKMSKQQISEVMKRDKFTISTNRFANKTNEFYEHIQYIKQAKDVKDSETYDIEFMKGIKMPVGLLFTTGNAQTFASIKYSIENDFKAVQQGFNDTGGQLIIYYTLIHLGQKYNLKFSYHEFDNGTTSKADDIRYYSVLINANNTLNK